MFNKRHQRLREDDTNSMTTNSNSMTNLLYNTSSEKVKAGVNGEPGES